MSAQIVLLPFSFQGFFISSRVSETGQGESSYNIWRLLRNYAEKRAREWRELRCITHLRPLPCSTGNVRARQSELSQVTSLEKILLKTLKTGVDQRAAVARWLGNTHSLLRNIILPRPHQTEEEH